MMEEWYPASELVGLAEMPSTVQGVLNKAKREGWKWQPRKGKGGGKVYHISSLPPETQASLAPKPSEKPRVGLSVVSNEGKARPAFTQHDENGLTPDEVAILELYRAMNTQQKIQAQTIVNVIAQPKINEGNE